MLSLSLAPMTKVHMVLLSLKSTLAGPLKPFAESSCIRYYNGNTFVAGPSVVGVIVLTIVDCLWTVSVMPVVKFDELYIEGPGKKLHTSNTF